MICANILIYYLLVTCCCCGRYLQFVSAAASSAPAASSTATTAAAASNNQQATDQINLKSRAFEAHERQPKTANHHVHKLMSEQDLRRTFQVDSHDQVPEYEVLKLQVNQDGSHLISPISDLGELFSSVSSSSSTSSSSSKSLESSPNGAADDDDGHHSETKHQPRHKRETSSPRAASTTNFSSEDNNKLIVIDLSTFGRDFKLRLKRNADFQQRIKDMKMFMAESTQDGQLKYTEVNHPSNSGHAKGKHHQEPHKRAAGADEESSAPASASASASSSPSPSQVAAGDKKHQTKAAAAKQTGGWNIGSTYHDEDNLAALLIDHDKRTGQLQIEGTIGNDFVIKPMPKATIEALSSAGRQQQQQQAAEQQLAAAASNSSALRLDKPASPSPGSADQASGSGVGQQQRHSQRTTSGGDLDKAIHMHDDDPHDDDEMFLDEDEAIELAQLQLTNNRTATLLSLDPNQHYAYYASGANNQTPAAAAPTTTTSTNLPLLHQHQANGSSARILSKAASERKWNKYRKLLLAQTQVPKLQQVSEQGLASQAPRARRHAPQVDANHKPAAAVSVSHHIVFRQRPSSEESSSQHQHSFMIAPGSSMERLAHSFQPKREKRHTGQPRLVMLQDQEQEQDQDGDPLEEADSEHDPLGGQFYLEPATETGFERAGHSDWSFQARRAPYSVGPFNHSSAANGTAGRQRFKRHARPPMMARGGSQVRRKRQAPDTVWPEVLLVVDYDSFLLHGSDSRDVKRYFVSFWNGVDLRYKLLVHPHIRISLAGMIVAKDRDATPYLERNRLRAPNADAVDAAGALTDMGKYLYREDRLPTYDLAVVITKLDMCRRRFEGGRCNRGTAGFAYVGGACVVNKRLEKVNSVAIIEDSGGFSGIIVAAHEVGHLLGCVHDGSPPPSYLGGPGATHCPWEDGFIMSDLRHTERGFRWSQCSVEQFKHFLNGETATCLYNYPHESQMLHRLLPGTMLSLDEQCKRDRGTNACFKDARVCAQLFCFDSASGYCVSYRPAAEGSPCGEGQVCRNGKCVGEIENIIPDYTHQSQTVVARARPASAHGLGRLADNGLSASSTSTATSSPDGKPAALIVGATGLGAPAQTPAVAIQSRMDTYTPLMEAPQVGVSQPHYSGASYASQFGGRYGGTTSSASLAESMASSSAGVVMSRQRHPAALASDNSNKDGLHRSNQQAQQRSAKLIGTPEPGARQYQQRSGLQARPKLGAPSGQKSRPKSTAAAASRGPSRQQQPEVAGGALRASASTLSHSQHQYQSPSVQTTPTTSGSGNVNYSNLLANSPNQFDPHHNKQPTTSSIQAANRSGKQKSAANQQHITTPGHSSATRPHPDGGSNVHSGGSSSAGDQETMATNVNHQRAQYEPQKSSTRAIYSSPAQYSTSVSSQYQPVSMTPAVAAAAAA